jgi:Na+-translocating ferredoxin:NAD+ oxidoreductase RnfD subunit
VVKAQQRGTHHVPRGAGAAAHRRFSVWQYGLSALALIVTVTATCLLSERLFNRMAGTASTLSDWSATITGLLLALTLPPAFPLWMGAVAGFTAIALGKALFGGIGFNVLNPALVGRAFVQAAFPVAITTWVPAYAPSRFTEFVPTTFTLPFMTPPDIGEWAKQAVDGFTGATPLARWKFENVLATPTDFLSGAVTARRGRPRPSSSWSAASTSPPESSWTGASRWPCWAAPPSPPWSSIWSTAAIPIPCSCCCPAAS